MNAAIKVLIGLVFVLVGLGLFVDSVYPIMGIKGTFGIDWIANFIVVVTGVIPIMLILIGLFVVWLEADEIKMNKELKTEETAKTKKKK
jgi:protein-S-isoprenylcysteine O-methyltransferase Ste14